MSVVLRACDVVKTFVEGETVTRVLRGVSLALRAGEFVALMGRSGSGKSTLLSILGTLMPPTSGTIEIVGRDVGTLDDTAVTEFRSRHIGFVFQFHYLLPDFTALENVMFPSYTIHGRATPEARTRATSLLDRIGLAHRADYLASRLSGGEKQRVAVARAIMNRPEVVLADEPTGNLDEDNAREVMRLLRQVSHDEGMALLVSTHDPEIASACDRLLRLADGRVESNRVVG